MYESPLIKMHQQIKKKRGKLMSEHAHNGINQHLEKKGGKVKSEHAHKRHQHLKKEGKSCLSTLIKAPASGEKKERENSCLGMLIKGTRDWKVKRGLKYAQNMSIIATKEKKQQKKNKQKNKKKKINS